MSFFEFFSALPASQKTVEIVKAGVVGRVLSEIYADEKISAEKNGVNIFLLTKWHERVVLGFKKQVDVIKEIQAAFPTSHKPIFVKGPTVAALTNNKANIRFSSDIDLLYDDLDYLKSLMISLGFEVGNKELAPHENSVFVRGDVCVEIHNYFPVLVDIDYPENAFHSKIQLHLPDVDIVKVGYNDLLSHSVVISNDIVDGILMTTPAMALLISAAHLYKDIVWQPYRIPHFHLVDLCEIHDLLLSSSIDLSELRSIALQFNSNKLLDYVFSLLSSSIGGSIPSGFSLVSKPLAKLMPDSYGPYFPAEATYFKTLYFESFHDTIKRIGLNYVPLATQLFTANLNNVYYASTSTTKCDFEFCIYLDSKKENVFVKFDIDRRFQEGDNFFVASNNNAYTHIWFDNYPTAVRVYGLEDCSIYPFEHSYELVIKLPIEKESMGPIIVSMGAYNTDSKMATVVPIFLCGM